MNPNATDIKPWYRQFWPWFLLSILIATVVYSTLFIYMAITTENALVSDDYYKEGLAINQMLERDHEAAERDMSASYTLSQSGLLQVSLETSVPVSGNTLILRLIHPTLADRDLLVRLSRVGDGRFEARLADLPTGRWYLDLRDSSNAWRLYGRKQLEPGKTITITPHVGRG